MNNFKLGDCIYVKPNAKEIQAKLDNEIINDGGAPLTWGDEDMDRILGAFVFIASIKKDNEGATFSLPIYDIDDLDGESWYIYEECLDANVIPGAKL